MSGLLQYLVLITFPLQCIDMPYEIREGSGGWTLDIATDTLELLKLAAHTTHLNYSHYSHSKEVMKIFFYNLQSSFEFF